MLPLGKPLRQRQQRDGSVHSKESGHGDSRKEATPSPDQASTLSGCQPSALVMGFPEQFSPSSSYIT